MDLGIPPPEHSSLQGATLLPRLQTRMRPLSCPCSSEASSMAATWVSLTDMSTMVLLPLLFSASWYWMATDRWREPPSKKKMEI